MPVFSDDDNEPENEDGPAEVRAKARTRRERIESELGIDYEAERDDYHRTMDGLRRHGE